LAYPPWTAPAATSFRTDSSRHGTLQAQVRGKMEPSHHSLSFPPNFKPSRALNHRQSDLQEASVCQPCPPAMEVSCGIIFVGPHLHTYLESWQTTTFGEKILGTLGDKRPILEKLLEKIERSAGDALMIFFLQHNQVV